MKSSASTEPYQSAFPWPHDPDPATDVHLASVITRCFVVADRDWEEHRPKIGDVPRSEVILNELHLYTRREDGGAAGALQTVEGASMLFDAGSPNLELWGTDNSVGLIVMILAIDPALVCASRRMSMLCTRSAARITSTTLSYFSPSRFRLLRLEVPCGAGSFGTCLNTRAWRVLPANGPCLRSGSLGPPCSSFVAAVDRDVARHERRPNQTTPHA
jgi:hypothetical protein